MTEGTTCSWEREAEKERTLFQLLYFTEMASPLVPDSDQDHSATLTVELIQVRMFL